MLRRLLSLPLLAGVISLLVAGNVAAAENLGDLGNRYLGALKSDPAYQSMVDEQGRQAEELRNLADRPAKQI